MRDKEAREEIRALRWEVHTLRTFQSLSVPDMSVPVILSAQQIINRFQELYDFLKVERQTETTKTTLKKKA